MVNVISSTWSNDSSIITFSGLGGVNTKGTRYNGDGYFYLEFKALNGRGNWNLLISPIQDKGWVSSGAYTDSLSITQDTILKDDVVGVFLDLTGEIGYLQWNRNGSNFSDRIPILTNSGGSVITDIKVGLVGSSSSIGNTSYELIMNPLKFVTNESILLKLSNNNDIYAFDGVDKIIVVNAIIKNQGINYSIREKTLIELPTLTSNLINEYAIKAYNEFKLNEKFNKYIKVNGESEVLGSGKTYTCTIDMSNTKVNKIII